MKFFSALNQRLERMSGAWLIFLGALFWSTAGAVIKSFDTDPLFLAAIRSLLGGLVLSFAIRPQKIHFDKWLFLLILCYAAMVGCVINSFRLASATMVIAMQYTASIWLFVLFWLQHKKPELKRLPVMALIIVAVLLFLLDAGGTPAGTLLALNMGWLFAAVSICLKRVRHDNALGVVAVMNLGGGLILLPICLLLPGVNLHVNPGDLPYILFLAVFQLSAGYFFYMLGIKKVTPQRGTLLAVWELVLTPVWAFLLVRELPSLAVAGGSLLLVLAMFWDSRIDSGLQREQALRSPQKTRA